MAVAGAAQRVWAIGNLQLLEQPLFGFFCSTKCPGEIILRTYDLAVAIREAGVPMIGGFHTPMEKRVFRTATARHTAPGHVPRAQHRTDAPAG